MSLGHERFPNLLTYGNLLIAISQVSVSFDTAAPDASSSISRDYLSRLAPVWLQGTLILTKKFLRPTKISDTHQRPDAHHFNGGLSRHPHVREWHEGGRARRPHQAHTQFGIGLMPLPSQYE
jgi:hypothetical protein